MRKLIVMLGLLLVSTTAAIAAPLDSPVMSAERFSLSVGLSRQWVNEFERPHWELVIPATYRSTENTYLGARLEKPLNDSDYGVALSFNWRIISGGKNTWSK